MSPTEVKFKKSFIALLNDRKFLPDGGFVGIVLTHQYPTANLDTNLDKLGKSLKGTDAAIKRTCDSPSLKVSPKMVFHSNVFFGVACLLDKLEILDEVDPFEDDIPSRLQNLVGALVVSNSKNMYFIKEEVESSDYRYANLKPILWLRPLDERNTFPYLYHENSFVYGDIYLVVEVEASEDRKTYL